MRRDMAESFIVGSSKRVVTKSKYWNFPAFSTHPPTPLSLRERGKDKARNELPPLLKSGAPAPASQEWGAIEGAGGELNSAEKLLGRGFSQVRRVVKESNIWDFPAFF